ncbi:MAG: hypothetical protein Q4B15_08960 [Lachnospiraceae bacterium]|nr:hypothetical protein [Lachnospiraceae bacterium]
MKQDHGKKMVAPIVITILIVLYYAVYFTILIRLVGGAIGALLGIIPVLLGGVMIYVCIQRIKEIQEGEEDDLSQY